jgi:hypothetical protein
MPHLLARKLVDLSVFHSERLRLYAALLIGAAAVVVTLYPLTIGGRPLLSRQVPVVMVSFLIIFALSALAEYLALYLRRHESVHICRCLFSIMAALLALLEVYAFMFGASPATAAPLAVSTLIGKLL